MNVKEKIVYILKIFVLALLYAGFGRIAFAFALTHYTVTSSLFFPEGIALGFLLLFGKKMWPGVFLGQLLLASTTQMSLGGALMISAGNTVEGIIGVLILDWIGFDRQLSRLRDFIILVLVIVFIMQPLSAMIGISSILIFTNSSGQDVTRIGFYWWIANCLGQVLITPLILGIVAEKKNGRPVHDLLSRTGASALAVSIAALLVFSMWESSEILRSIHVFFLVLPVVVLVSVYFELSGAASSSLALAIIAQIFTVAGYGPFSAGKDGLDLVSLHVFIFSICVSGCFTGILFHEKRISEQQLKKALNEIKTLQGILPICSNCKKIRNDKGLWEQMEIYIEQHSTAEFSHGLCEECLEKLYGNEKWFNKGQANT